MNNKRRDRLEKANAYLSDANSIIDTIHDEEEDSLYNMPDNLQNSDRYEQMENCVDLLSGAIECIEDAINKISEAINC